tara:strand:- start:94 stop:513 length:420 start_codon:yes stop_codon:yes gene_type:complete
MSKKTNKENKLDIFEEAAKLTAKQSIKTVDKEVVVTVEEQALELTKENGKSAWARLKDKVNGEYADRAMNEIEALSGREFIKVYMKLLEFVNPKITRKEIVEGADENKEIKILIMQKDEQKQEKVIDVTHSEITKEEKS